MFANFRDLRRALFRCDFGAFVVRFFDACPQKKIKKFDFVIARKRARTIARHETLPLTHKEKKTVAR